MYKNYNFNYNNTMEFVGIDKMSLLDYEDMVSCVLFAPTCNYRCPFCHNGKSVLESSTYIPYEDILDYLKSRVGLIDAVVISGGEPTMMKELKERIMDIKEMGFKIKLDTNGSSPDVLKDLIDSNLLDYVAMDIKNSLDMYPATCGVNHINEYNLMKSINILKENKIPYEFRTTLVKEFHNKESIKKMGELIKGAEKLYLQKFVDRETVLVPGLHEVDKEEAEEYLKILSKYVKEVNLRGY